MLRIKNKQQCLALSTLIMLSASIQSLSSMTYDLEAQYLTNQEDTEQLQEQINNKQCSCCHRAGFGSHQLICINRQDLTQDPHYEMCSCLQLKRNHRYQRPKAQIILPISSATFNKNLSP